jgi:hypothetical protein
MHLSFRTSLQFSEKGDDLQIPNTGFKLTGSQSVIAEHWVRFMTDHRYLLIAIRLYPTAPAFSRHSLSKNDIFIGDGYRIKPTDVVNVPLSRLHRDTAVWVSLFNSRGPISSS